MLAKAKAFLEKQAKERGALLAKRKATHREVEAGADAAAGAVPSGAKPWERVLRCGRAAPGCWVLLAVGGFALLVALLGCNTNRPTRAQHMLSTPRARHKTQQQTRLRSPATQTITRQHKQHPNSVVTFNREDAKGQHVAKDPFKELSRFKAVLLAAKAADAPVEAAR